MIKIAYSSPPPPPKKKSLCTSHLQHTLRGWMIAKIISRAMTLESPAVLHKYTPKEFIILKSKGNEWMCRAFNRSVNEKVLVPTILCRWGREGERGQWLQMTIKVGD